MLGLLWDRLRREPGKDLKKAEQAKRAFEGARTRVKKKREEIKRRRLPRAEAAAVRHAEVEPLEQKASQLRQAWRTRLADNAPDPVVSLGANLNVSDAEFRAFCADAATQSAARNRTSADFCAGFGAESGRNDESRMEATPLALIHGTGHQDFLGSAQELMVQCTADRVRRALLESWSFEDEKYSLRWDPFEDRRYALMAQDPTAPGNKPRTVWAANRLGFEALPLFPCVVSEAGTETLCVRKENGRTFWHWPLWRPFLTLDTVRSLLTLSELTHADAIAVGRLRARGVTAVYRTERIAVGSGTQKYLNLTPAVPLW